MRGEANLDAAQLNKYHLPAIDNAAICTISAVAGHHTVIDSIHASFDGAMDNAKKLDVLFGGTGKWAQYLTEGAVGIGPHDFTMPRGLYTGTLNEEVLVQLAAPSNGAKGSLSITYRTVPNEPNLDAVELNKVHAPTANTAAVCTIAAVADQYWCIDSIHAGFTGAPAAVKKLNVTINAVEVWAVDIGAALNSCGPHEFLFPRGLYSGALNQAVVVTLEASGDAGESGIVAVTYR